MQRGCVGSDRLRPARRKSGGASHVYESWVPWHVDAIAKQAGVSPQTIYFTFNNKSFRLIRTAAIDAAVMGPEETAPQEQAWWKEMLDEPDPARRSDLHRSRAGLSPGHRPSAMFSQLPPAPTKKSERSSTTTKSLRGEGFGQVLDALATKGALRPDLPQDRLLDIFPRCLRRCLLPPIDHTDGMPTRRCNGLAVRASTPSAPGPAGKLISGAFTYSAQCNTRSHNQ